MVSSRKKASFAERRIAPVRYISTVSVKDKIFFLKLLFRWTGSVWQTLWLDLLVFVVLYIIINSIYTHVLKQPENVSHRLKFEAFVDHVQKIATNSPLSMLLGFFVTAVLARWWEVALKIPSTDQAAIYLQTYITPVNRKIEAVKVRLTVLRYMNLAWIMAMKTMCRQIHLRFKLPGESKVVQIKRTMELMRKQKSKEDGIEQHLEKINDDSQVTKFFGDLITPEEIQIITNISKSQTAEYADYYWLPLQWCHRILTKARQTGIVASDFDFRELVHVIDSFRSNLSTLITYNDINIPLVYTQVIVIAVYAFFLAEIFSSQVIKSDNVPIVPPPANQTATYKGYSQIDNYIPIFSIFKFIFFMGWFKTAASLLNPLGSDQEALPTSQMLDDNLKLSIESGGADDDVYPAALSYDGNAEMQITCLDPQPNFRAEILLETEHDA